MAGMSTDLEILKDIPGYKAILKSVLKSQIQLLIEQLSDHTGEETIILTASVHDGTLSHLGSITGKGFLDGRDEIKSQFLAFCLKSHHRRKSSEARLSPYQRPPSGSPGDRLTPSQGLSHKRPRLQPVSLQRAGTGDSSGNSFTPPDIHRAPSQNYSTNGQDSSSGVNVKLESEQSGNSIDSTNLVAGSVSFPTSLQLSHTQTSAEQGNSDTNENQNDDDFTEQNSENDDSTAASIKIEPITESEMELEITGVEPGKSSVSADAWGQGQVLGPSGGGDGAPSETGDQSGYNLIHSIIQGHFKDTDSWRAGVSDSGLTDKTRSTKTKTRHSESAADMDSQIVQDADAENPTVQDATNRKPVETRFPCRFCGKFIRSRYDLGVHERIHTGEKPFTCTICGKGFTQKNNLESHKIVHMKAVF